MARERHLERRKMMTQDQLERLAQIGADVAGIRDFVRDMAQRLRTFEHELKELKEKEKTQDSVIQALRKAN